MPTLLSSIIVEAKLSTEALLKCLQECVEPGAEAVERRGKALAELGRQVTTAASPADIVLISELIALDGTLQAAALMYRARLANDSAQLRIQQQLGNFRPSGEDSAQSRLELTA